MVIGLCAMKAAWAKPEKLDVLAIWDSSEYEIKDSSFSPLHRNLEVVFNHYGLRLHYIDVNKKIEKKYWDSGKMSSVLGIVAWFTDNKMKRPQEFLKWLHWNVDKGRKVLLSKILVSWLI